MTRFEHYLSGKVFGIKYVFENVGDGLPAHAHDAVTAHNVCVLRGRAMVEFDDHFVVIHAGDVFDFDGTRLHSITAEMSDTCVLNMFLNGQPIEYRGLPPHELKGEFDVKDFKHA